MQSYLYLHAERIKGIYTQLSHGMPVKKSVEKSNSVEGSASGSFLTFLSSSLRGAKGNKIITETIDLPENMVSRLIETHDDQFTKRLVDTEDWTTVKQGSLIAFRGNLDFDSYGLSKEELWKASYDKIGERKVSHDLRLHGQIGDRLVEIPFSSNYIAGASQFTVLCHAMFDQLEGLAVVMSSPNKEPVILQPLAFGNGFIVEK